ncbi:MAG TPA: hypothetical protein VGJ20_05470 [Xanthobacteraceae bacterium]|jgi:hypothetical protein
MPDRAVAKTLFRGRHHAPFRRAGNRPGNNGFTMNRQAIKNLASSMTLMRKNNSSCSLRSGQFFSI